MRRFALTEQPKIRTRLVTEGDEPTKDLIRQLAEMHGVGAVVQTQDGNFRAVRLNTISNTWETRSGGLWSGVGTGTEAGVADYAISGTINQITAEYADGQVQLALPQDIHPGCQFVCAGLRVSGLSSELLKVGATGVVAEAVEGTDYAGVDYANVFTAAQKINVDSAAALLVEQDGVHDNTLVVDTDTGRVAIAGAIDSAAILKVNVAATEARPIYVYGSGYTGSSTVYGTYVNRALAAANTSGMAYSMYAGLADNGTYSGNVSRERWSQYNNMAINAAVSGSTSLAKWENTGLINYIYCASSAADTSDQNQTLTMYALDNSILTNQFITNKDGGTLTWVLYGLRNTIDCYDNWGGWAKGKVNLTTYGTHTTIPQSNNCLGASDITITNYGAYHVVNGTWGADASYPCKNFGYYADCQNGSHNYAFYSAAGDWVAAADNQKFWFGAGLDATIYYDGTDLIVNSDDVGSGGCKINALNIRANGSVQPIQLADGDAANDSIYYSTTQSKLVYKDSGGGVNDLY